MPTYSDPDPSVPERIAALIASKPHFADLRAAGVTVYVQMAAAARDKRGSPKGPALKLRGVPAAAIVSITPYKFRKQGVKDARIEIDGDTWDERPEREQEAILFHELLHLLVRKDKDGNVLLDDCHRPKLRMRPHDFEIGAFFEVMEEYREHALETQSIAKAARKLQQLDLPWG